MVRSLIEKALNARLNSYSPYSGYAVGAALVTDEGAIYTGCNIENASYGAANCAERTTIFKAVSEGAKKITKIAIVGGPKDDDPNNLSDYAFPCGICRQVMREFCDPNELKIIVAKSINDYKEYTLNELLPESFGPDHLNI